MQQLYFPKVGFIFSFSTKSSLTEPVRCCPSRAFWQGDRFDSFGHKSSPLTADKCCRCQHEKARCLCRFDPCRSSRSSPSSGASWSSRAAAEGKIYDVCVSVGMISEINEKQEKIKWWKTISQRHDQHLCLSRTYDSSHQHTQAPQCGLIYAGFIWMLNVIYFPLSLSLLIVNNSKTPKRFFSSAVADRLSCASKV